MTHDTLGTSEQFIDRLNALLKEELSAVDLYEQAMKKTETPGINQVYSDVRGSHADRILLIENEINVLGGEPAPDAGLQGAFAKTLVGTAELFGEKATVSALEQTEDNALKDYKKFEGEATGILKPFARDLLSKQEQTHDRMSKLKHGCHCGE